MTIKSIQQHSPILTISSLILNIEGINIINNLECQVNKGEKVGIIGPNGSGKTTLFNCISGFISPNSGEINFKETNITNMPPYKRARLGIGRVFQNFGIFKDMTVLENIIIAIENREGLWRSFFPWSKTAKKNKEEAMEFLTQVNLEKYALHKASSLSGGQMRLLEIMRALAFGADLFLLDEPTAGVAPKMKDDIANLINMLQKQNKTVMIIEHDMNFIENFCERILVVNLGKINIDDNPTAVRTNPLLQKIYFGS